MITNNINGKKYVGQTSLSVEARWQKHCSVARCNDAVTGIDGAIRKYGSNNFSYITLKECPINELDQWEIYYIKEYGTYQGNNDDKGYNLTLGGQGGYLYDIDEDELLNLFNNGTSIKDIAKYYHCCAETISIRLKKLGANIKQQVSERAKTNSEVWKENFSKQWENPIVHTKAVYLQELDKTFSSLTECSQWLIDNHYTTTNSVDMVRKSLSRHLNGERKSYLSMHFSFI